MSGPRSRYGRTYSGGSRNENVDTTYASRRYNYRSRSDMGNFVAASPRRYGSQTILDAPRPGPATSATRREALDNLQRELNNISRGSTMTRTARTMSPEAIPPPRLNRYTDVSRGYTSDTGAAHESMLSERYSNQRYQDYGTRSRLAQQRYADASTNGFSYSRSPNHLALPVYAYPREFSTDSGSIFDNY